MRESPGKIRELAPSATGASPVAALIRGLTSPWGERSWLRAYSVAIAAAVFLSLVGANGTAGVPAMMRFGYWLVLMMGGTIIVQVVFLVSDRWLKLEPLAEAFAMFLIASAPITVFVWWTTSLYMQRSPDPASLPRFIVPVAVITGAMSVLQYLFSRQPKQSHEFAPTPQSATEPAAALRERLPFKHRQAEIYALSAEDHYLRVYTSAGETLILMRLYDAIRELDGIEGSQTHRSWWVAKSAVRDVIRNDGKVVLTVGDDLSIPVSRGYAKALKDDGWL